MTEPGSTRVAFRGFRGATRVFEEFADVPTLNLDEVLPSLAEKHAVAMANGDIHMIEIEFLDDPSEQRFFRFGTSPEGMVLPVEFDLSGIEV